jgi:hypothetical protein
MAKYDFITANNELFIVKRNKFSEDKILRGGMDTFI